MRADAIFIGIEVADDVAGVRVDVDGTGLLELGRHRRVELVERNIDECILCDMCVAAAPPGAVAVHRLYDTEAVRA